MGEILTALMRWVHISSAVTLIGGIVYARFVMIPAEASLSPDARTALDDSAAAHFRPVVFTAMAGLVLSGLYNYLSKPGHSAWYHAGKAALRGGGLGPYHCVDLGLPEGDRLN